MHEFKGSLNAAEKRFAIVAARFNEIYTERLVEGAVDSLLRMGADEDEIKVYWVPGSFEVPGMAQALAATGTVDAVICLGVLIRGETLHYDLVANQAAAGIAEVYRHTSVPCTFGIVTAENQAQAQARCGGKMGNRGWDAAQAAVEMVNLSEAIEDEEDLGQEALDAILKSKADAETTQ